MIFGPILALTALGLLLLFRAEARRHAERRDARQIAWAQGLNTDRRQEKLGRAYRAAHSPVQVDRAAGSNFIQEVLW